MELSGRGIDKMELTPMSGYRNCQGIMTIKSAIVYINIKDTMAITVIL